MSEARLTGEAIAALLNTRLEGSTDQIAKSCPLFADLKKSGRIKFGKGWVDGVEIKVHKANSLKTSVVSMGDWQQAQAVAANDRVSIDFPGSNLVFALAKSALRDERLNNLDDKTKVFDLMLEEMNDGKQALGEVFAQDLYGDGTQRAVGLVNTLAPTVGLEGMIADDNTYAGRVRSTDTWWKSQVKTVANGGSFLNVGSTYAGVADGVALMRQVSNQIKLLGYTDEKGTPAGLPNRNEDWDAIYCDQTSQEKYQATFDSRILFQSNEKMDASTNTVFEGKPVKVDAFCTASRMYFLQWAAIELWSVKKSELFGVICEDTTNLVQAVVMNTQHCFFTRKPRVLGKLKTIYS